MDREERGEIGIDHKFSTGKTNDIIKSLTNDFLAHSFLGTGTEDQRIPRADCLTKLKMQDAGSESQACHHAADGERCGGTP